MAADILQLPAAIPRFYDRTGLPCTPHPRTWDKSLNFNTDVLMPPRILLPGKRSASRAKEHANTGQIRLTNCQNIRAICANKVGQINCQMSAE